MITMKNPKLKYIVCIVILLIILIMEIVNLIYPRLSNSVFRYSSSSEAELKDELIIALLRKNIVEATNAFYSNYFTEELELFNYEMRIVELNKESGPPYVTIKLGITPMIGAHNPVGYDEAVFKIDPTGNVALSEFVHMKTYEIPERFRGSIKQPLPRTN